MAKLEIDNQIIHPVIDLSVGIGIEIKGITTTEITIGPTTGIGLGTTIGMTLEGMTISLMIDKTTIDKTIGETATDKTIEGTIEIDKSIEEIIPNRCIGIGVRIGVRVEKDKKNYSSDNSRSRDEHIQ